MGVIKDLHNFPTLSPSFSSQRKTVRKKRFVSRFKILPDVVIHIIWLLHSVAFNQFEMWHIECSRCMSCS